MIWAVNVQKSVATRHRRSAAELVGVREARAIAATLGGQIAAARRAKRLSQRQLGDMVGLSQARISEVERGEGGGAPFAAWIAIGIALGRPFAVTMSRILTPGREDGGHLAPQELVLRLAKGNGIPRTFELPTRPANPTQWIDVGLRDDRRRVLSVVEIGNRVDDLGGARRAFKRHLAEAEALAVVAGADEGAYRVAGCWVLRATAANRELVARYPAIFEAEFPGSSRAWVKALTTGAESPRQPGIVWVDLAGTRIYEVRQRSR